MAEDQVKKGESMKRETQSKALMVISVICLVFASGDTSIEGWKGLMVQVIWTGCNLAMAYYCYKLAVELDG